ncbi:MAG: hypothetical protein J3Q66DRAFT_441243 [Benniella sp.]|nr:MAG: hypothetical protein J3Q66DRAFT_441243 [Benniella sp.]
MSRSLSSTIIVILLLLIPIFLSNESHSPSVRAQSFRPSPAKGYCSSFVEGEGFYIIGGSGGEDTNTTFTTQTFMLDLSVSWNTSDPVFKELASPMVDEGWGCAMAKSGDELFVLSKGTVYLYNVKSASWTTFHHNSFPGSKATVATDPETGFIYIPDADPDFSGKNQIVLAVDINTRTVNTTLIPAIDFDTFGVAAWSAPLKSMLVFPPGGYDPYIFTPSKTNKATKGWDLFITPDKQLPQGVYGWDCMASAYGGSKMVLIGYDMGFGVSNIQSVIFILDVVKRTWKKTGATNFQSTDACAVTGDLFIVWGGIYGKQSSPILTNSTRVFNVKTEKWITSYIAPPRPTTTATTTSFTSQLLPTPTQYINSDLNDVHSSDKKLATIIAIIASVLVAIILTVIVVYLRKSKRSKVTTRSTSPDGASSESPGLGPNLTGMSSTPHTRREWYMSNLLSWLYQGPNGIRPPLEHPHAIVEEKRNVQEGAVEVEFPAQHPHATVEQEFTELESIGGYNNKEEFVAFTESEFIRDHGGKEELFGIQVANRQFMPQECSRVFRDQSDILTY